MASLTADQRIRLQIGDMVVQLAAAASKIEELEEKVKELESKPVAIHGRQRESQQN